jgi:coenzyme F420-reducing hydrogenase beta subunit
MITYIKDNTRKNNCFGCCACQNVCPTDSISMVQDNEGFLYPHINEQACISCGKCENVCPVIFKYKHEGKIEKPFVYAALYKNEDIRKKSSSGGIFTVLARYVFENHGVVFGVGFDKDFNVIHKYADNMNELEELRGSKYVQSYIGNTYKQAEKFLKQGRRVLFSGTPCQIAGLQGYLGRKFNNLITCDIICHGTPSPKVYKMYLSYISQKKKSSINKINFRNKNKGWKNFSLKIKFKNKKTYISDLITDPFLNGFLKNLYLRPSCHICPFSNINRISDITLGDYWGVAKYHPEMDDDKGTSLVLINTEKGKEIFEKCKSLLNYIQSNIDWAIAGNSCLVEPCIPHKNRENFFKVLNSQPFENVLNKYMLPPSLVFGMFKKIILFGKRVVKHILKCFRLILKK